MPLLKHAARGLTSAGEDSVGSEDIDAKSTGSGSSKPNSSDRPGSSTTGSSNNYCPDESDYECPSEIAGMPAAAFWGMIVSIVLVLCLLVTLIYFKWQQLKHRRETTRRRHLRGEILRNSLVNVARWCILFSLSLMLIASYGVIGSTGTLYTKLNLVL